MVSRKFIRNRGWRRLLPLGVCDPEGTLWNQRSRSIGRKNGDAAIGAAGEELRFAGSINSVVDGHGAEEYTPGHGQPEVPSEAQTPNGRSQRQPAAVEGSPHSG